MLAALFLCLLQLHGELSVCLNKVAVGLCSCLDTPVWLQVLQPYCHAWAQQWVLTTSTPIQCIALCVCVGVLLLLQLREGRPLLLDVLAGDEEGTGLLQGKAGQAAVTLDAEQSHCDRRTDTPTVLTCLPLLSSGSICVVCDSLPSACACGPAGV
jgi:hypothetical protein